MKKNAVGLSMKFGSLAMILVIALLAGTASAQTTINVSTWAEFAAANPVSGDTVVLAAGTYTADAGISLEPGVIYKGAGDTTIIVPNAGIRPLQLRLEGVDPPVDVSVGTWTLEDVKIMNGDNRGLRCYATDSNPLGTGETFSPQTVYITRVTFENLSDGSSGGAIEWRKGELNITDCTFTNCSAISDDDGGAINSSHSPATLNIVGTAFTNCTASDDGGAIFKNEAGTLNVTDCTFTDCGATGDDGGAIMIDDTGGVLNITNSTFTNCSTFNDGGALRIDNDNTAATIVDCTFTNCDADDDGGAIFAGTNLNMIIVVTGSTFTDCDAGVDDGDHLAGTGDDGGAIYFGSEDGALTITGSTFTHNSCNDDGGAISSYNDNSVVTIDDCVFDGNFNFGNGDGAHMSIHGPSTLFLTNSILMNGKADSEEAAVNINDWDMIETRISNCLFVGNEALGPGDQDSLIKLAGETIWFANNTLVNNVCGDDGILYVEENVFALDPVDGSVDSVQTISIVISNNIFLNNSSGDELIEFTGGNIEANGEFITISNNLFFDNITGTQASPGDPLVDHGLDHDNWWGETGRIELDPLLDPVTYKPTADSAAIIDASDPTQATATDLEGTAAVGVRDVGAYELSAPDPAELAHDGGTPFALPKIRLLSGDTTSEATLTVWNAGDEDLNITGAAVTGEGFSLISPTSGFPILLRSFELNPGDTQDFVVGFDFTLLANPSTAAATGLLSIDGDDPATIDLKVEIEAGIPPTSVENWLLY